MKRTVLVIVVVLAASLTLASYMDWTGETYAVFMMAVDGLAAAAVLLRPSGKAQAMIGLTFLLQMAAYFARLLHGDGFNVDAYWWQLAALAILQLGIAGGWWIHELASGWRPVSGGDVRLGPAHHKGLDR